MCGVGNGACLSFPEESDTDDSIFELILFNNLSYNLHSFVWESVYLGKSPSSKMACVEQKMIFPCIWHIKQYSLFIPNEYHQFRIWHKFVGTNFTREKHIDCIAKDTKVWCFEFVTQKNLLRCFALEISNRYVYISYSCYCKFPPGIW